ncbi:MAG: hypothetical protein GY866_39430 [Proteobacteria bacterium]|nr:hypothetical protein [Pseudomonadota bacterium]
MAFKRVLDHRRIRGNHSGFGFVPHRFPRDGFLSSLEREEAALYLFYILAADRHGVSFYGDRRIGDVLGFSSDELRGTREGLVRKDLIRLDDNVCRILELPDKPTAGESGRRGTNSFSELARCLGDGRQWREKPKWTSPPSIRGTKAAG